MQDKVSIPHGVTVTVDASGLIICKGPKGEAKKMLRDPLVNYAVEGPFVVCTTKRATLRDKKMLYTMSAHISNLVKGVTDGFTYKLKICSGHFPMSVTMKGNEFIVKNLFGEAVPRVLVIKEGAKVTIAGELVEVTGTNKEIVGQISADIENLVKRVDYDRRIFQDGIYITDKNGKIM